MPGDDQQSRLLYELCDLLLTVLRSPPPSGPPPPRPRRHRDAGRRQFSVARFVSLLLGASMALMLCGSLTFVIGFFLMPWLLGFVLVFCVVAIVSSLSGIGGGTVCNGAVEIHGISGKEMQR